MDLEVCINCESAEATGLSVRNAREGGAARVELCRDMSVGGLTPAPELVRVARQTFGRRDGVLAMVRPRDGDFVYSRDEVGQMEDAIRKMANCDVGGVVLGLTTAAGTVDLPNTQRLVGVAKDFGLSVTFHRAFDALQAPVAAVDELVGIGVDRILTSGCPWNSQKSAIDGIETLKAVIARAAGRLEVVIGGGVARTVAARLMTALPKSASSVSLHAYSGVTENGVTARALVEELCDEATGGI